MIAYSGNPAELPPGYRVCDGTDGTPDLRDRFIVGVGSSYEPGATGGTVTNSTYHSHTITGGHHGHDVVIQTIRRGLFTRVDVVTSVEDGSEHTHSTDTQGNVLDNRPPYYALYYVCLPGLPKVSASLPYTFTTTSGAVIEVERRFTYADVAIISLLVFLSLIVITSFTWSTFREK